MFIAEEGKNVKKKQNTSGHNVAYFLDAVTVIMSLLLLSDGQQKLKRIIIIICFVHQCTI